MMALLLYTSISEFFILAVVILILFVMRARDERVEQELRDAIGYAVDMQNNFRAIIFLRAVRDGDIKLLQSDFPGWLDYRDGYMVEAV